jgi:uncharacterized RDD family membrane protein YckC
MHDWYVWRDDDGVDGPHALQQLRQMRDAGHLDAESKVRAGIEGDHWVSLENVLASALPASPGGTDWASLRFRETAILPDMPRLPVEDDGWQQTVPAPWRRLFGRTFDIALFGSIGGMVLASTTAAYFPRAYDAVFAERTGMLVGGLVSTAVFYAMVVAGSGLLLGLTGTTPGKWLFGTRVTRPDGRPIGILAALRRELAVLVTGQGLGVPVVALVANFFAYSTLKSEGVSSWDSMERWVVTHRPWGSVQMALSALLVLVPASLATLLHYLLERTT